MDRLTEKRTDGQKYIYNYRVATLPKTYLDTEREE